MEILDHLDKLRVFTAVARLGKINEAAADLNVTQPSVTRTIQKLEEILGVQLFVRGRTGVRLTNAGTTLYKSAVRVLKEMEDTAERVRHADEIMSGRLVIGTYESLAEYLWPEFLMQTAKLYPNLSLNLRTSSTASHGQDLAAGLMDLLVDAEPRELGECSSYSLYTDSFAFYASARIELSSIDPQTARHLALLFVPQAFDKDNVSVAHHLSARRYVFSRQYAFDSFSTVKSLALHGLGVAVLPQKLAAFDVKRKLLRPVQLEGFPRSGFGSHGIYASVSDHRRDDPRLRVLLRLLREHLR